MHVEDMPRRNDVSLAKTAVRWDENASNSLVRLFPTDNNPDQFRGDRKDLRQIREAMRRYEVEEAQIFEDMEYYKARYRLQFVEVDEE